ncbi:MAG: tetrahydrofolate dehydrogenase/cyclohydrolase catalytic domain-containing protein, partial [Ignavibacteriaceae bacterium]
MILIDGKKTASEIRNELKIEISRLVELGKNIPGLVAILVGENPASEIYVRSKAKACEEIGMRSKVEKLGANIDEEELLALVSKYNNDNNYHGILVQLP